MKTTPAAPRYPLLSQASPVLKSISTTAPSDLHAVHVGVGAVTGVDQANGPPPFGRVEVLTRFGHRP